MEFRILGPLEAVRDGQPLTIGAAKHRALLGLLLVHADQVVSSDRLIDGLWGDEAPATAGKALQVYVSQLRKALGPEIVSTRAPGYSIHPGELDLRKFEERVALGKRARLQGDAETASRELGEALALWRGPALSGLEFEPFAAREIARLEELRLAAVEERVEADLELGRQAELVAELEALVVDNPHRERLARLLVLALYRSGRQADALAAYRRTREELLDMGLEPGRELRELEVAILNQDPALDPSKRVAPAPAAPDGPDPFVGRDAELGDLHAALEGALAGRGAVYLLAGEPGIGKSRLADEVARRAEDRGAVVLWGRGWEAGGAPAYWVWVQALRSLVQRTDPDLLRAQLGSGAGEVAQILPIVRELLPGMPEPAAPESEGARFRLFDAVAGFVVAASADRPLVLVLDDLHAADTPSLLLLQFVARELGSARVLILATYRDVAPVPGDALSGALGELARERLTRRTTLDGLAPAEVAHIVQSATGADPSAELVDAIHQESEGNPLFVGELARLLASEGSLDAGGGRVSIPLGIREVIGQRLGLVSDNCRRALALASVIGREFDLAILDRLAEAAGGELHDALDEAIEARLVVSVHGAPGRLGFAHALIRDTLYEELPPIRRAGLHRQVGTAIEAVHARDLDPHLAELAHHFREASVHGGAEEALDYARRAGDRAVRLLAFEEATRLYRLALDALVATAPGDVAGRADLLLALGEAHARAGEGKQARDVLREAAAAAREAGIAEQLARAAVAYGGRFVWPRAVSDDELVPLLDEALAALGVDDSPMRVRVLGRLTCALRGEPSRERTETLGREAIDMARRLEDDAALAYALDAWVSGACGPDNADTRFEETSELIAVSRSAGDVEREFSGHENRLHTAWELGRPEVAEAELERLVAMAEALRQPAQWWLIGVIRAYRMLFAGEFAPAEQLIEETYAIGRDVDAWSAGVARGSALLGLYRAQGRLAFLEETHQMEQFASPLVVRCARIHLDWDAGRDTTARDGLEALLREDISTLHLDEEWLLAICLLVEPCQALGDAGAAQTIYDALSRYGGRMALALPEVSWDAVDRSLGVLAGAIGRWDEAERHFAAALDLNTRMGGRPWIAQTRHDHAAMLLARDESGDRERANELLVDAIAGYAELGMDVWADRARALAGGQSDSSTRSMR